MKCKSVRTLILYVDNLCIVF